MKRLSNVLLNTQRGLHTAAFVLAAATIGSQLLALLRDRLLAGTFGVGEFLDVYYASFRLPDLVFVSVASLFSSAVIIPFLVHRVEREENAGAFFSSMLKVSSFLLLLVCCLFYFLMPWLVPFIAPGVVETSYDLFVSFSRILLLSPFLLGLSGVVAGATQAYRHFLLFSLAPLLYNIGIIVGIVFLYPLLGPTGLVWGVVLGAALHVGIQLPVLFKYSLLTGEWISYKEIVSVLTTSLPRTLSLSMTQIQVVIFTALASVLGAGSIAAFQFGFNLQSIPLSLIGVSYATAAFPALSSLFAAGDYLKFGESVRRAEGHIVLWSFLLSALFVVLSRDIVEVVLGVGAFSATDAQLVSFSLILFVVSLVFQGLLLLYARACYAMHYTAVPLVANLIGSACAISLAFWGRSYLLGSGYDPLLALPFGFSIGAALAALLIRVWYVKYIGSLSSVAFWLQGLIGFCIAGGVTVATHYFYISLWGDVTPLRQFFAALCAGIDGGGMTLIYWYVVGLPPARELVDRVARILKVW